jgi:small subunit ribosomal protein S7
MADKLFGKYSLENIVIRDKSMAQVVSLQPVLVPHTFGRQTRRAFGTMHMNVVERLANKLMRGGTGAKTSGKVIRTKGGMQGKKLRALGIVDRALAIVEEQTKENPVQVLIRALENAAPREDVTRVSHGGVSYQVSVDVSATRRLDASMPRNHTPGFPSAARTYVRTLSSRRDERPGSGSIPRARSPVSRKGVIPSQALPPNVSTSGGPGPSLTNGWPHWPWSMSSPTGP